MPSKKKSIRFQRKKHILEIENIPGTFPVERTSKTRRSEKGTPIRKAIVPTNYWTYNDAKKFLNEARFEYEDGTLSKDTYADIFDKAGFDRESTVDQLARKMDGLVRRRAHERNLWEKFDDILEISKDPNITFADLRHIILSGGKH